MKTWQNQNETNLPIDLLIWVVKDGIIPVFALKTFLYLKLYHEDRFVLKPQLYTQISQGLKINVKTARSHVTELIQSKFIGYDPVTKMLYVRSKYKIIPDCKRNSNCVVTVAFEHLEHFTEFILAATIAYIVRKKLLTAKYRLALKNDGAFQSRYAAGSSPLKGYPLSQSYIAKFIGCSTSWVAKFKAKAKKLRWIAVKRFYIPTKVKWDDINEHCALHNIPRHAIKKRRGHLYIKGPDLLKSNIKIKKGKKVTKGGTIVRGVTT